jgi:hypothetical protein
MTNLEMLIWGVNHIAENHHFKASTADWEEDGQVCIWGGCNVPTLTDVRMLCEDLGIPHDFIESNEFGIDVFIPEDWLAEKSELPFDGQCMWQRVINLK